MWNHEPTYVTAWLWQITKDFFESFIICHFCASATIRQCMRYYVFMSSVRVFVCPSVLPSIVLFLWYVWCALMDFHQTFVSSASWGQKVKGQGRQAEAYRAWCCLLNFNCLLSDVLWCLLDRILIMSTFIRQTRQKHMHTRTVHTHTHTRYDIAIDCDGVSVQTWHTVQLTSSQLFEVTSSTSWLVVSVQRILVVVRHRCLVVVGRLDTSPSVMVLSSGSGDPTTVPTVICVMTSLKIPHIPKCNFL